MRLAALLLVIPPLSASMAEATDTATYRYDALGRLQAAEHRGGGGTGYLDSYAHDRASNRTKVERSGAFQGDTLAWHGSLTAGQNLLSSDGRFRLALQFDGNVALFDQTDAQLWSSGTAGSGATWLVVQNDGNVVLYTPSSVPVWTSGTAGNFSSHLVAQSDGNLVLYRSDNVATWSSGTCCH